MKSEFLESELELYVQRLLIHESYATGNRYKMLKISPNDERLKGYDAEIVGMTSFYCQFKTSDLLTKGALYNKRNAFCKKAGWPSAPFYSFALRVPNDAGDKKNAVIWQHNVLHSLWKTNPTGVAYVAPLFHTRAELDLHEPPILRGCCLCDHGFAGCCCNNGNSSVSIQASSVNGYERCRLPLFDSLISIPPHAPVKDLKHSYCFTSSADITFHSDPVPVKGNMLGETLRSFVLESLGNDGNKVSDSRMTALEVSEMLGINEHNENFLESFLAFGLMRAGVSRQARLQGATSYFENEATWLQQRISFAAALKSFFDISTLGLFKVKEY